MANGKYSDGKVQYGQEVIPDLGLTVPFTERMTREPTLGVAGEDIDPINIHQSLVRSYNPDAAEIASFYRTIETLQQISLPDTLSSVAIHWNSQKGDGTSSVDPTVLANAGGLITKATGSAQASASLDAEVVPVIVNGYSGPCKATLHVFFLAQNGATLSAILTKTGASQWPIFKPQPVTLLVLGGQQTVRKSVNLTIGYPFTSGGPFTNVDAEGSDRAAGTVTRAFNIPPTLHAAITPSVVGANTVEADATVTVVTTDYTASTSVVGSFSPSTIPATSPSAITAGNFLYAVDVTSYAWGYVRIGALVVNLSSGYLP